MSQFARATAQFSLVASFSVLALATGCGGSTGGDTTTKPPPVVVVDDTPAAIAISPSAAITLLSGTSATLSASVTARDGHVVPATVSFSSSDPSVASVTGAVVTGAKIGVATLTATSGTLSASVPVAVLAGAAAQLALRTQPAGAVSGLVLATQPVVELRDAAGNFVSASTQVTATLVGTGTLAGTVTVPANTGVATFTDLAITGTPGTYSLTFTAVGAAPITSAPFPLAAPPSQLLVIDTTAVSFTVPSGQAGAARTIGIRSGGSSPLTGVTIDPPVYDPGQPTGWLSATLTGTAAPFLLKLTPNATALPVGSYRAVVKVNSAGAANSPVSITVSLIVSPGTSISFGTPAEKLRILDVGASYAPALSARDPSGQPITPGAVTYSSRAATVATVTAQGAITAVGPGESWVVVSTVSSADSVFVIVPRTATGPVLRGNLTTYSVAAGDTTLISIVLDTRSTPVGAVSVAIGYTAVTTVFSGVAYSVPSGPPLPAVSNPIFGLFRVTAASATPLAGSIALLNLRVVTTRAGTSGVITLVVTEIFAPDGSDLLPVTTSTRIPIIVK